MRSSPILAAGSGGGVFCGWLAKSGGHRTGTPIAMPVELAGWLQASGGAKLWLTFKRNFSNYCKLKPTSARHIHDILTSSVQRQDGIIQNYETSRSVPSNLTGRIRHTLSKNASSDFSWRGGILLHAVQSPSCLVPKSFYHDWEDSNSRSKHSNSRDFSVDQTLHAVQKCRPEKHHLKQSLLSSMADTGIHQSLTQRILLEPIT